MGLGFRAEKKSESGINLLTGIAVILIVAGCANKSCREPARIYPKKETLSEKTDIKKVDEAESTVFVFKYDGSAQCDKKSAISLGEMEQELKGIEVYSREKKHDGLMHLQVCGAKTGNANVYEIRLKDFEKAVKRNFRKWDFD